jgi:hypothetical protein
LRELSDPVLYAEVRVAYNAKYKMDAMEEVPDANSVTWYLEPKTAMSWREADFPNTATRWSFPTP